MGRRLCLIVGLASLFIGDWSHAADPPRFEFKDGDRVVLIGDTLIERDQEYGYLETLLTLQNPGKNLTFRNLGWSGDTVAGEARAGFGTPAEGFRQLKEHVLALKPTVILVGYGMTDSFDGEAGLPRFVKGLNTLLDALTATGARMVLLSPIDHEDLPRPLPDPARHNQDLERYARAIEAIARERGSYHIRLSHRKVLGLRSNDFPEHHTDDGIHLNESGSWVLASVIDVGLGFAGLFDQVRLDLDHEARTSAEVGSKVSGLLGSPQGLRFEATDAALPAPPPPFRSDDWASRVSASRRLKVRRLAPGRYALKIDGKPASVLVDGKTPSAAPTAQEWAGGVSFSPASGLDQVERLRRTINAKNRLYFYRWRPQNETYLFGFRKHEQGNNAREIPLFDPLVAEKEKEIARLRVPVTHVFELVRESEVAR